MTEQRIAVVKTVGPSLTVTLVDGSILCKNCGRNALRTRMINHHIVPRQEAPGADDPNNRMPLCSACERFIHFNYPNIVLAKLKKKVLLEKDVQLFGMFVNTSEYKRHADVRDIENDFRAWKSREMIWDE